MRISSFFLLFSCLFFLACAPGEAPFIEITRSLSVNTTGNYQTAKAGDYFSDSVGVVMAVEGGDYKAEDFNVHFEIIAGGGSVSRDFVPVKNNRALTYMQTGTESSIQKLKAVITDKKGEKHFEQIIRGTAFAPGRWDTMHLTTVPFIRDVLFDTLAQKTTLAAGCFFYKQTDNYYNWTYFMPSPDNQCPTQLLMTDEGDYFSAGASGGICISQDRGNSWEICEQPLANLNSAYRLNTSGDGTLWAGCYSDDRAFFVSNDKGQSWEDVSDGLANNEFARDIYRVSDDSLFMLSNFGRFYKSGADDISWQLTDAPEFALKFYITAAGDFILINQDDGITVYKSNDYGETWQNMHNVRPEFHTSMSKSIQHINNRYFLLIPGYGIMQTQDFEEYTLFYNNSNIRQLYRNHENVLIAYGSYQENFAFFYNFE